MKHTNLLRSIFLVVVNLPLLLNAQTLLRGPYLQMGNSTSITIRWRTNILSDSKVEIGTQLGSYPVVISNTDLVQDHIIRITDLQPDTKYYYRIGTNVKLLQGGTENFFTTVPLATTKRKVSVAFFGDCGRDDAGYQDENLANYRSYLQQNGIEAADAWVLLGDNAYSSGTDFQYGTKFFGIYGSTILKNHKLYPAPGNHDYANDEYLRTSRTIAYYNIFSTPKEGECGGAPSGKPNFYSFDIGNIHFLSLDSWGIEADHTEMGSEGKSEIKSWIHKDLSQNKSKWVVAYWHHPPYTKGTHNSDTESELINIRNNFIEELEKLGVDLVVCGHSHNYERGYLMKGFKGYWNTFNAKTHAVSTSSATYTGAGSCPYVYNSSNQHHGTVYVVAGSSGASGTIKNNFGSYAMPFAVNDGGVFYVEVEDNRLDAKMLRRDGSIFDQFTIIKDANKKVEELIKAGSSIELTASWPAQNYSWNQGDKARSITVTPASGQSTYTVTDNFGCITDTFFINAEVVLPVSLSQFDAKLDRDRVLLNWATASETNSSYFKIERSVDGRQFESIGTRKAAGNSSVTKNYSFEDHRSLKGTTYYRLGFADADGTVRYSDLKIINNTKGKEFDVRLAATGKGVKIYLLATEPEQVHLSVFDLSGKLLKTANWNINRGSTQQQLDLPKGASIFKFSFGNREPVVQKLFIE